jgi:hypothetical protein
VEIAIKKNKHKQLNEVPWVNNGARRRVISYTGRPWFTLPNPRLGEVVQWGAKGDRFCNTNSAPTRFEDEGVLLYFTSPVPNRQSMISLVDTMEKSQIHGTHSQPELDS